MYANKSNLGQRICNQRRLERLQTQHTVEMCTLAWKASSILLIIAVTN